MSLLQALRSQGSTPDFSTVQAAYRERDGRSSVVPRPDGTRILEVAVADGVPTVRIALE